MQSSSVAFVSERIAAFSMTPSMTGCSQVVKFLVDHGARVSAKDDLGETALMKACCLASCEPHRRAK